MPFTYPFIKTGGDDDFGPPVVPQDPPPTGTTTTTTTPDPPPSGTKPGGNIFEGVLSFLNPLLTSVQTNPNGLSPAMLALYLGQTANQFKDSGRWTDMAEKYAGQMDPFADQRGQYAERLKALMTNPEDYLKNDPFYQGQMRLTMGPAAQMLRSKGYGNSGNILSELTKLSGDVTSKYINELRDDLGHFGGADITPSAAASLLAAGMRGSIDSRNAALGSLANVLSQYQRNEGNGTPTGGGGGISNIKVPADLLNLITANGGRITADIIRAARELFGTSSNGWNIEEMQNAGLSADQIMQIITDGNDTGIPYPEEAPEIPPPDEPPPLDTSNDGYLGFDEPPPLDISNDDYLGLY